MVTCWRRNAKSALGRTGRFTGGTRLTGGGVGATVAVAVVTTSSAGTSRLWPTAVSLVEGEGVPLAALRSELSLLENGALAVATPGGVWSLPAAGRLAGVVVGVEALGASHA